MQLDSMDCGLTCLRMVAKYFGKSYSLPFLREKCYIDRAGVSLKGISEAAELIGLRSLAVKIPLSAKKEEPSLNNAPLPTILHWKQNHFVVLYKINKKFAWIADPADGKHKIPIDLLKRTWLSDDDQGVALLLEATPEFFNNGQDYEESIGFGFLKQYLVPHRALVIQLILGLFLGTVFQLIFPFLTQKSC